MVLVLVYFELNQEINPAEISEAVGGLVQKGIIPTDDCKYLGWQVTPDLWGVAVLEVASEEAFMRHSSTLRIAKPGLFKSYRSAIAMETKDVIPLLAQLNEQMKE